MSSPKRPAKYSRPVTRPTAKRIARVLPPNGVHDITRGGSGRRARVTGHRQGLPGGARVGNVELDIPEFETWSGYFSQESKSELLASEARTANLYSAVLGVCTNSNVYSR